MTYCTPHPGPVYEMTRDQLNALVKAMYPDADASYLEDLRVARRLDANPTNRICVQAKMLDGDPEGYAGVLSDAVSEGRIPEGWYIIQYARG